MADQRGFDLVLFGATGFTGALTAAYLALNAPAGCRWALAGRNSTRLEAVRDRLVSLDPGLVDLPLLAADATDPRSLQVLAQQTRVLATTVGPYVQYGEPLVAACAEAGTDYVDLTGEPEFADRMYLRHHETALASGARIVHACGFDSVPHDLGAWFTVQQLPADVPLRLRGMLRAGGGLSRGTVSSALTAFSRLRQTREVAAERRRVEPHPAGRRVRAVARPPHRDPDSGRWLVPLPTIDPVVVRRSAAALGRYGPDFEYAHYAAVERLPVMLGGVVGVGVLVTAAQVPPLRRFLVDRLVHGEGPSIEQRASSWFRMRFVGEGGGRKVTTEVSGGDPGYDETAKMLAEAALCLAFDDNPETAGNITSATAMAARLTARLMRAGIGFDVLEDVSVPS
jgi:short subunit dehydrogenase-like uncharacterized protein